MKTCRRRYRATGRMSRDRQRRLPVYGSLSTLGGSPTQLVKTEIHGTNPPRSAGVTLNQTLYNGDQNANKPVRRRARSRARAKAAGSRTIVLLSAATIYMDYLRDAATSRFSAATPASRTNAEQTRDRFNVGEVTRTDVAQSKRSLPPARPSN